jgi:DNA-binding CsgD family transcriptional regulator
MQAAEPSRAEHLFAPGALDYTHRRFHLEISESLLRAVPSAATFSCLTMANARSYSFLRWSHKEGRWGERRWLTTLRELLPVSWAAALDGGPKSYTAAELGLSRESGGSLEDLDASGSILLLMLFADGRFQGLVGLERAAGEPAFSAEERRRAESLSELVSLAARLQVTSASLACESAALRALGSGEGLLLMADQTTRTIFWVGPAGRSFDWQSDVAPIAEPVLEAASQLAGASSDAGQARIVRPRIPLSIDVAEVDGSGFDVPRSLAIRVRQPLAAESAMELSKRERQVARLLLEGYGHINIAAITGLSENTIRTYVRRLYRKVGVCSRFQLVQAMCSFTMR